MGLFDFLRRRDNQPSGSLGRTPAPVTPAGATGIHVRLPARAPVAGDLRRLDALDLPPGRLVHPDSDTEAEPVAWVTDQAADHGELWARLLTAFPETGLWPMAASGLGDSLDRPWFDGELGGPEQPAADAETVLRARVEAAAELQADYGPPEPQEAWKVEWAGLAAATAPATAIDLQPPDEPFGLLLVPVRRPADVPAAIGWWGPTNHDLGGGELTAVLRSWEDRFGAVLTTIGFDTLELTVGQPPDDAENVVLLAREHYQVCPEGVDEGAQGIETSTGMLTTNHWYFWWD